MKYLPLRDLENVTSALNFNTSDCHVTGGCDLYTTKAAGNDKKLYKSIESSLESQHESLLRLSESLSPPNAELFSLTLSRSSPFGPLSQVSSRRTFAYLIATLNASHPDYDFSHFLRPSDFRKEKSLRSVMHAVDEALYNLRPRTNNAVLATPNALAASGANGGPQTPGGSQTWSPRMWRLIDKEMNLRDCEIYCYAPDDDPFDGEESAIWSLHYFFFNKDRKRVCYVYLRGLNISSHSPTRTAATIRSKRPRPLSQSYSIEKMGASKRAKFWLGDRADRAVSEGAWRRERNGKMGEKQDGSDHEEEEDIIVAPGDDEIDADEEWGPSDLSFGESSASEDDDELEQWYKNKSGVRRMSEHIAESMEV